jgi:hypothetical protein
MILYNRALPVCYAMFKLRKSTKITSIIWITTIRTTRQLWQLAYTPQIHFCALFVNIFKYFVKIHCPFYHFHGTNSVALIVFIVFSDSTSFTHKCSRDAAAASNHVYQ